MRGKPGADLVSPWRVIMVAPTAGKLIESNLVATLNPPTAIEKLCDELGKKTQVLTLTLPYTCTGCGTTTGQQIDVGEHHAVLKFATAPELRCTSCKAQMSCVAGEQGPAISKFGEHQALGVVDGYPQRLPRLGFPNHAEVAFHPG